MSLLRKIQMDDRLRCWKAPPAFAGI